MKKVFAVGVMVILSLFAVGCEKTIELTDEESYLIAEYAADLLIKYDDNLHSKYYDTDGFVSPHNPDNTATPTDVDDENTTEDSTETTSDTEQQNTTENTGNNNQGSNSSSNDNNNVTEQPMDDVGTDKLTSDYDSSEFDLAGYLGIQDVKIMYQHYILTDVYPSYDSHGAYIEVEAPEGYKLLVLKFKIENKTNESQSLNLYDMDIQYRLIVNKSKSARHMLTILMNDLYTYQSSVGASMIDEAVLLFQVSDSVASSIDDLKLKIQYKNDDAVVQLR